MTKRGILGNWDSRSEGGDRLHGAFRRAGSRDRELPRMLSCKELCLALAAFLSAEPESRSLV
jgi:hypothetical protein